MKLTFRLILLNLMIFGCTIVYTDAQVGSAEGRERSSPASSLLAEASGHTVQFSIGDRRVAVAALKEFDRAGISYTVNVFEGETVIYTTKDAAPTVGEIMNRTVAELKRGGNR